MKTPMQKDKGNKRSHDQTTEMEIDVTTSSKRFKGIARDQEVVDLDLEESILLTLSCPLFRVCTVVLMASLQ